MMLDNSPKPVFITRTLSKTDQYYHNTGSPSLVQIRQATKLEFDRRFEVIADHIKVFYDNGFKYVIQFSYNDLQRLEVMLTLADCNILDYSNNPLFTFKDGRIVDENNFLESYAQIDQMTVDEIYEKVLEINPSWKNPLEITFKEATINEVMNRSI